MRRRSFALSQRGGGANLEQQPGATARAGLVEIKRLSRSLFVSFIFSNLCVCVCKLGLNNSIFGTIYNANWMAVFSTARANTLHDEWLCAETTAVTFTYCIINALIMHAVALCSVPLLCFIL